MTTVANTFGSWHILQGKLGGESAQPPLSTFRNMAWITMAGKVRV